MKTNSSNIYEVLLFIDLNKEPIAAYRVLAKDEYDALVRVQLSYFTTYKINCYNTNEELYSLFNGPITLYTVIHIERNLQERFNNLQ